MADNRTEKATPKRREEARKKGQMARSADLTAALVLLATIAALGITGPALLGHMTEIVRQGLMQAGNPKLGSRGGLGELSGWAMRALLTTAAPIVIVAAAAATLGNVLQNRPRITSQALKPQWSRINPQQGFKRLVGTQALFTSLKTFAKAAIVALAAFVAIWPQLKALGGLTGAPPGAILITMAHDVFTLAIYVGGAFVLLGAIDFAWQRRQYEKQLRMTKEEIKQEGRQSDLAPEVRSAIRRRQFAQARKRMIADVATADVVVTNPTHFAVALRYDGTQPAPEVVAKGADLVAQAIREAAEAASVPVLENPPLARALYREVQIGQQIPESLFQAVAEVLAYVYRRAGRRRAA